MADNMNDNMNENEENLNEENLDETVNENVEETDDEVQEVEASVIEDGEENAIGNIEPAEMAREMQQSFLEYSMSVIVARALPDVRDGLKPVHRRILYAMNESGYLPTKPHMKSARTVGDVIGKYHPHGDSAVYDTMVRLAQPFSMRLPLVDGHGNFGSIDGDSPAAMRYTEARLDKAAMEMLRDLDKDTVDWMPNYDETLKEPEVLPARFPCLLVNGSNGIAVGMATNVPPHNLGETIDATVMMLENDDVSTEELMTVLPGPDFPTGGQIMGTKGIREAYETGHGNITLRATFEVQEKKNGRQQVIVKEIPYMVNRKKLMEKLGELVREKEFPEISNIHDGADRHGIDIIIELKSGALAEVVINKLCKHTQLQTGIGINMLALVDGTPRVLSLREILQCYIKHQIEVVTRRTIYDKKKAEERAHILEGYIIALDHIDEVIKVIRGSETDKEAKAELISRFELTERQAEAILEMKLRRLTGLEREKIEEELKELREKIDYLQSLLDDETKLRGVIKDELLEIKKKFTTARKTVIGGASQEIDVMDLIADDDMVVTLTNAGYVKRLPATTYRQQRRGGKGMQGVNLKESDFVEHMGIASAHSWLLMFSSKGKVYRLRVYEIPEASRQARGTAIVNLLSLEEDEKITAVIATKDFPEDEYLMFATKRGLCKKTSIELYDRNRQNGLKAISLKDDDELISVSRVCEGEKVLLVSSLGKAIMWDESEVRAMGRDTQGVKGMNIPAGAQVLGMEIAGEGSELFVVTEKGYGKRTAIEEYPEQHRGGQGVYTIQMTQKKGLLVGMKIVNENDEIMIISEEGVITRTAVKGISKLGRSTQGVKVMNIAAGDKVTAVAVASAEEPEGETDSAEE